MEFTKIRHKNTSFYVLILQNQNVFLCFISTLFENYIFNKHKMLFFAKTSLKMEKKSFGLC